MWAVEKDAKSHGKFGIKLYGGQIPKYSMIGVDKTWWA
jgi:hypothetical protein